MNQEVDQIEAMVQKLAIEKESLENQYAMLTKETNNVQLEEKIRMSHMLTQQIIQANQRFHDKIEKEKELSDQLQNQSLSEDQFRYLLKQHLQATQNVIQMTQNWILQFTRRINKLVSQIEFMEHRLTIERLALQGLEYRHEELLLVRKSNERNQSM